MNAVRQIVDGNALAQIIKLPKYLQSRQVEVIVMPVVQDRSRRQITRSQLDALLSGSNTEALTGSLSIDDIEIDQIRAERRTKSIGVACGRRTVHLWVCVSIRYK